MKKTILLLSILVLTVASSFANPCGGWGGYRGGCYNGGGWRGGYCGWGGAYYGGYCSYAAPAPIVVTPATYPYAGSWVNTVPVVTAPPTGIGISIFGLNILGINPTVPVAVPAQ